MPKTLRIWEWGCPKRGDAQNAVTGLRPLATLESLKIPIVQNDLGGKPHRNGICLSPGSSSAKVSMLFEMAWP